MNPYGGPYLPPGFGTYPNNFLLSPQWQQYASHPNVPIAYAPVHTEYEGFLVPVQTQPPLPPPPPAVPQQNNQQHQIETIEVVERQPPKHVQSRINSDLSVILRNLLPANLIFLLVQYGSIVMNLLSIIAFGGLITTAVCSLTPICTISFAGFPLAAFRSDISGKKSNDSTTTVERVRRAAEFFSNAIEKYEKLQKTLQIDK